MHDKALLDLHAEEKNLDKISARARKHELWAKEDREAIDEEEKERETGVPRTLASKSSSPSCQDVFASSWHPGLVHW